MSDLIRKEDAVDLLTELSCDDNAHWGAIIDAIRAIHPVQLGIKPRGASGEIGRITVPAALCGAPMIGQYEYVAESAIVPHPTGTPAPDAALRLSIQRKIGMYGAAYDGPFDARAYTYDHQPGNQAAWAIGKAAANAATDKVGDHIDRGLGLLRHLKAAGFGVFSLNCNDALIPEDSNHG